MPIYTAKSGSTRISVLKNGPGRFVIAWYPVIGGKRVRESFSVKKAACDRADEIAAAIAAGQADVLTLTSADRDSYRAAVQQLAPLGIPIHAAIADFVGAQEALAPLGIPFHTALAEYVAAKKALPAPTDSLLEAAQARTKAARAPACPPTLDLIARFIATLEDDHRSEKYIKDLQRDLRHFAAVFPDLTILAEAPVRAYLRALLDKRTGNSVSDRRRDNVRDSIVALCNFAARVKLLPRETAEVVSAIPQIARKGHVTTYTPAELLQVLSYLDTDKKDRYWLPWAAIAAFAGLRTSEIYRLEWSAFKWTRGFIGIESTVAEKVGLARHAPLLPVLAHWLAPWRNATGLVLPRKADCKWKSLEQRHTRARARIIKALQWPKWKSNALRHSFGSHRLGMIEDIAKVAHEMGNSPGEIRQSYNDSKDPVEAAEYFRTGLPTVDDGKIIPITA